MRAVSTDILMKKNTSALLINEGPLQVLPSLAVTIGLMKSQLNPDSQKESNGLNEAIVLQQLHYRLRESKNIRDERQWVYDSYEEWQERHFPFWSWRTVQRIFLELERLDLVFTSTPGGRDRRKWYAINYELLNQLFSNTHTPSKPSKSSPASPPQPAETEIDTASRNEAVAGNESTLSDVPTWHDASCQLGTMEDATLVRPSAQVGTLLDKVPKTPPKIPPENTHTQQSLLPAKPGGNGNGKVCVCETPHRSKLCDEERIRIAKNISSIRTPEAYAMAPEVRRGRDDAMLLKRQKELQPSNQPTAPERDTSKCPDCKGRNFYYPSGDTSKGVVKCLHPQLDTQPDSEGRKELQQVS
jgi:hypothetical protein